MADRMDRMDGERLQAAGEGALAGERKKTAVDQTELAEVEALAAAGGGEDITVRLKGRGMAIERRNTTPGVHWASSREIAARTLRWRAALSNLETCRPQSCITRRRWPYAPPTHRGASRWRVMFTVTLPLVVPGILAGGILGFAKALGEFGATITFVAAIPGQTQTIPTAIYGLLQVPGEEPAVLGLVIVSVVLAMGALLVSEWLARRMARKVGR